MGFRPLISCRAFASPTPSDLRKVTKKRKERKTSGLEVAFDVDDLVGDQRNPDAEDQYELVDAPQDRKRERETYDRHVI